MDANDAKDTGRRYDASAGDVALKYGVSPRTVLRWCETSDIPHRRLPGGPRFNMAEVDEWAIRQAELRAGATKEPAA